MKDALVKRVNLTKNSKKFWLTPSKAGVPKKKFNLIRKENNVYEFADISEKDRVLSKKNKSKTIETEYPILRTKF